MQLNLLIENIDNTCHKMQVQAINSVSKSLTLRNWIIGYYIVEYEQMGQDRAKYGDKLIENIAQKLSHQKGMSAKSLRLFRSFYNIYPQISQTVSVEFNIKQLQIQRTPSVELELPAKQLLNRFTFSHFIEFLRLDDTLKRTFYNVVMFQKSKNNLKREFYMGLFEGDI